MAVVYCQFSWLVVKVSCSFFLGSNCIAFQRLDDNRHECPLSAPRHSQAMEDIIVAFDHRNCSLLRSSITNTMREYSKALLCCLRIN